MSKNKNKIQETNTTASKAKAPEQAKITKSGKTQQKPQVLEEMPKKQAVSKKYKDKSNSGFLTFLIVVAVIFGIGVIYINRDTMFNKHDVSGDRGIVKTTVTAAPVNIEDVDPNEKAKERESLDYRIELAKTRFQRDEPEWKSTERTEAIVAPEDADFKSSDGVFYTQKLCTTSNEITVLLSGDMMATRQMQKAVYNEDSLSYNFTNSFAATRDMFHDAELVIASLPGNISSLSPYSSERNKNNYYNASVSFISALRSAGIDGLATASNHTCDCGVAGIVETTDSLTKRAMPHVGSYEYDESRFIIYDVNGIQVAVLSYTDGLGIGEKYLTKEGRNTMVGLYSQKTVKADIKAAKKVGADFVIVYIHFETESQKVTENQRKIASEIAKAGADYIAGISCGGIQKFDYVNANDGETVPCIFSMGNFFDLTSEEKSEAVVMELKLARGADGKVTLTSNKYIPCCTMKNFGDMKYVVCPTVLSRNSNTDFDDRIEVQTEISKKIGTKTALAE